MIDLRLTVTDAEKAAPLFKRQVKPYLLHEESGMKVPVASSAKTGSLRFSGVVQEDRTYVMLFANPGRSLKVGHKVKLIVGDYSSEELVIQ